MVNTKEYVHADVFIVHVIGWLLLCIGMYGEIVGLSDTFIDFSVLSSMPIFILSFIMDKVGGN